MKKFNSILAIAAVALTSVLGFTSCDKNDDSFNNQTPVVKGTADNGSESTDNKLVGVPPTVDKIGTITLGVSGFPHETGKTFEDAEATFTVNNPEGLEVTVSSSDEFIHVSPNYFSGFTSTESTSFKSSEKTIVVHAFAKDRLDFSKSGTATITMTDSKSTRSVTLSYKNEKHAVAGNYAWASWAFTFNGVSL